MSDKPLEEFVVPPELLGLVREAAWELDELARILPDVVPLAEDSGHFVVRGIAGRLLRLSSVIQSVLDGGSSSGTWLLWTIATLAGCMLIYALI